MQLRENKILKQLDNWVIYEILKSIEQSDSKSRSTSEGVNLYHLYSHEEVVKSEFGYVFFINDLVINEIDVLSVESFVDDNNIGSLHTGHSVLGIAGDNIDRWKDCLGKNRFKIDHPWS